MLGRCSRKYLWSSWKQILVPQLSSAGGSRRVFSCSAKAVPKERVDCVVIGAGVVGLAVARQLGLLGRDVLVLDTGPTFGTATSSRNSEVIHAGIYYPRNSLKATLCVRGRDLLYKYCSERGIPHEKVGKLIVATGPSEVPKLNHLKHCGSQNGVAGLKMIEASEAIRMEPNLQCVKALLSPDSGILDTHSFMLSLVGEAEANGATFSYNSMVTGGRISGDKIHLNVSETFPLKEGSPILPTLELIPNFVVNSAGLGSQALAKKLHGIDNRVVPSAYFARGCYFTISGNKVSPFKRLIYPIPEEGGLGVHVTIDLNGQIKFGPDVEWVDDVDDITCFMNKFDYSVSKDRAKRFYGEIKKYYPSLPDVSLEPGYAGIRPKLSGPKQPSSDFVIQGEETHGVTGLMNLFGIESPGLTSSLAIAEYVAARFSVR